MLTISQNFEGIYQEDDVLDAENLQKADVAFGRVWSDSSNTIKTKVSVYTTCVLISLLYSSET